MLKGAALVIAIFPNAIILSLGLLSILKSSSFELKAAPNYTKEELLQCFRSDIDVEERTQPKMPHGSSSGLAP